MAVLCMGGGSHHYEGDYERGEMPEIPDSEDGERMERPDPKALPTADTPEDVPGSEPK